MKCVAVLALLTLASATSTWDATFHVALKGKEATDSFTVRVHPDWAPLGAKRFEEIIKAGIFKDARFFRVVPNFMAQFGIPGDPKVAADWHSKTLHDDPSKESNKRGRITFATSGPNTRTTQMFINFKDNSFLDSQGFSPFAEVLGNGMNVVDKIQSKYKEQPDQGSIQSQGNSYLASNFPELSVITGVELTGKGASFLQEEDEEEIDEQDEADEEDAFLQEEDEEIDEQDEADEEGVEGDDADEEEADDEEIMEDEGSEEEQGDEEEEAEDVSADVTGEADEDLESASLAEQDAAMQDEEQVDESDSDSEADVDEETDEDEEADSDEIEEDAEEDESESLSEMQEVMEDEEDV